MRVLVSDELWAVIESLLPKQRRSHKGGRPPVPNPRPQFRRSFSGHDPTFPASWAGADAR